MGKYTLPGFVLSLELENNPLIFSVIEARLKICKRYVQQYHSILKSPYPNDGTSWIPKQKIKLIFNTRLDTAGFVRTKRCGH